MKFKKTLLIGIVESMLGADYWARIDKLTTKKVYLSKDDPKIKSELQDVDCLLVNFGVTVGTEEIDAAPNLKYIGILATAYGKVNVEYAKEKGIVVCNLPGYSTESVVEFIFAAILENLRDLERAKRQVRETGSVDESSFTTFEIKGKTFGILGLGSIGKRVAEIALCFGANVGYWSRSRKKDYEKKGVRYEDLDSLIAESDFLSINLAQVPQTESILNKERLSKVKSGAIIINTAPMELVDLEGLEERLKKKDMIFILDHSDEMTSENVKRLSKYPNCIVYPPIAYVSKETTMNRQEMFTSNIENFLKGKSQNVVN